jgi:hypothetical protein
VFASGKPLTREHHTILERLATYKHSSLSPEFVNYGQKSFKTLTPDGDDGSQEDDGVENDET